MPKSLIIATSFAGPAAARLAALGHQVLLTEADRPWEQAMRADVLWTGPMPAWRSAPAPAGWPGKLSLIQSASTGINDYPRWMFEGVTFACTRGVSSIPIAEFAVAAMLGFVKRWDDIRVTAPTQRPANPGLGTLHGQTLGLLGFGSIGREIAMRALAFGMQIKAARRSAEAAVMPGVVISSSWPEVLADADHVVLALPSTTSTRRALGREAFLQVRRGCHLVNVSRGDIVDHEALLAALDDGRVGGATLDVTDPEPLPADHPLYRHPRVRISPHLSWSSDGMMERVTNGFLANLERFSAEQPLLDVVDRNAGY